MKFQKYHIEYIVSLLFFISSLSFSQNIVQGTIVDEFDVPIASTSVQLQEAGQVISYSFTDSRGEFRLDTDRTGDFLLVVQHLSFEKHQEDIEIKETSSHHLKIKLELNYNVLESIVIVGEAGIATQKGDTLSYNLGVLTTGNEQKLKDVIEKIPGLSIEESGQIMANGKPIDELLFNGKKAFGDNHQLATGNVDAKMLEGMDLLMHYDAFDILKDIGEGNKTALNIHIKEEYLGKTTGNVEAVGAYNNRYKMHANLFKFDAKSNLSVIADLNNTGEEAFSILDYIQMNMSIKKDIRQQTSLNSGVSYQKSIPSFILENNAAKTKYSEFAAFDYSFYPSSKVSINGFSIFNFENSTEATLSDLTFFTDEEGIFYQKDKENAKNKFFLNQTKFNIDYTPSQNKLINYSFVFNPNKTRRRKNTLNSSAHSDKIYEEYHNRFNYSFGQQISYTFRLDSAKLLAFNFFNEIEKEDEEYQLGSNHFIFDTNTTGFYQDKISKNKEIGSFIQYTQRVEKHVFDVTLGLSLDERSLEVAHPYKINKASSFADISVKKNKGIFQYYLTTGVVHSRVKNQGKHKRVTHFLPKAEINMELDPTHTLTFNYSRKFDFPSLEVLSSDSYVLNFRNIRMPSLLNFHQLFLKNNFSLQYYNMDLFSGRTIFGLLSFTHTDKAMVTDVERNLDYNKLTSMLSNQRYINVNTNISFQQRLNGFINFNTLVVNGSFGHTESYNLIDNQNNKNTMELYNVRFALRSNYKNSIINYEIGSSLMYQQFDFDFFDSKNKITTISPFVNLNGHSDKLNIRYFIDNSYQKYRITNGSHSYYNLSFKILYDNDKSDFKFWLTGKDVFNITNPEFISIASETNVFSKNSISQLAGYIGLGVSYDL